MKGNYFTPESKRAKYCLQSLEFTDCWKTNWKLLQVCMYSRNEKFDHSSLEPNFLLRSDIEFLVSPNFCVKIGPLKNKSTFYNPDKIIGYATRHCQSRGHLIEKRLWWEEMVKGVKSEKEFSISSHPFNWRVQWFSTFFWWWD